MFCARRCAGIYGGVGINVHLYHLFVLHYTVNLNDVQTIRVFIFRNSKRFFFEKFLLYQFFSEEFYVREISTSFRLRCIIIMICSPHIFSQIFLVFSCFSSVVSAHSCFRISSVFVRIHIHSFIHSVIIFFV